ncbi:MAG TPA: flavodoxin family protein [Anaerolineae bacterium]
MKTLIIYDSFFGNTEQVAQAIGKALSSHEQVEICRVSGVKPEQLEGVKLLIVGSPTRGFRPTPAIMDLLKGISANALQDVKVATFDTRIATSDIKSTALRLMVNFGGYAAAPIAALLKKKGGEQIAPPEGFFVQDREGPLKAGELERAANWARQLSFK